MFTIVFQGAEPEATATVLESVVATRMLSRPSSREAPGVPWLSCDGLPMRMHAVDQTVDSSLISSPDLLERCAILSDLSNSTSPATISSCTTPCTVDGATPQSVGDSRVFAASENVTDVRETPLSARRSGRRRKRQKRRLRKSALPDPIAVDCSEMILSTSSQGTVASHIRGRASDITIKKEPKMPKLLPEPRVEYNPETPLRISIHLPLSGLINAADDGLGGGNVDRLDAVTCSGEDHELCSAGCSPAAMPVDLTSRASVHVPQPISASSAADVKRDSFVDNVSSSVSSVRPVYSPISSTSSQSAHDDDDNDDIASPDAEEMPQPSVGIIASFLDRFSGLPAESLQFSPSQSFWTRSFAEQLAELNQNSFAAAHRIPAPMLSHGTITGQHITQLNVDNSFCPASHPSLVSMASSMMNTRPARHSETRDCVAVRPTVAAENGLNRIVSVGLPNADQHAKYNVGVKVPVLSNGECRSSSEAVSLNDIVSSETVVSPGMAPFRNFDFC